jgi:hypothetical protein
VDQSELLAQLARADALRPEVGAARQALRDAAKSSQSAGSDEKGRQRLLQDAATRLAALESGRGSRLTSFGEATVYEFWIEVPGYSGPVRGASARLTQHGDIQHVSEVKGKTKGGLGGAVVGGALLGPVGAVVGAVATRKTKVTTEVKQVDTRQFELELSGPGFAWATTQGPGSAPAMQKIRDTVNARGSSSEDVKALASAQAERVEAYRTDVETAAATSASAVGLAGDAGAAYDRAWNEYAEARLPFADEMRGRWSQSKALHRAGVILVFPVLLLALLGVLGVAISNGGAASVSQAIAMIALYAVVLVVAALVYINRVRPSKGGSGSMGKTQWFKKWWVWAIALVVLAAIASVGKPSTSTDAAAPAAAPSTNVAASANTAPAQAAAPAATTPEEPTPAEPAPTASPAQQLMDGNFGIFTAVTKSGKGDGIVKVPADAVGGIVTASHSGSSNFAIETLDSGNQNTGLLVNEIGRYSGVTMFTSDEAPVKLKVTADGKWTIKIAPVSSARMGGSSNSGKGDAVLLYDGAAADWKFTHSGSSNFAVKYINTDSSDLLVNEIGHYSGVVPAGAGPAVVIITADGKWTMKAQ